ncbi:MAG TPA: hypothetical protein VNZ52_16725 [Candidatus Thermoplasmatota archaeon]|nr:hypothetical protein [Candidatus Thermoplasmatota archaeon]
MNRPLLALLSVALVAASVTPALAQESTYNGPAYECPLYPNGQWSSSGHGAYTCGPTTATRGGTCPEGHERHDDPDGFTYCNDPHTPPPGQGSSSSASTSSSEPRPGGPSTECPYGSQAWTPNGDGTYQCGEFTAYPGTTCPAGQENQHAEEGYTYCYDPAANGAGSPSPGGCPDGSSMYETASGEWTCANTPGGDSGSGADGTASSGGAPGTTGSPPDDRPESYNYYPGSSYNYQCEFGPPYRHSSGNTVCPPPPKGSGYCGGEDVVVDESGGWGCRHYQTTPPDSLPEGSCPEGTTAHRMSETSWSCQHKAEGVPECPSGWKREGDKMVCYHGTPTGATGHEPKTPPPTHCGPSGAVNGPDGEWYCASEGRSANPDGSPPSCNTGTPFRWVDGKFFCTRGPWTPPGGPGSPQSAAVNGTDANAAAKSSKPEEKPHVTVQGQGAPRGDCHGPMELKNWRDFATTVKYRETYTDYPHRTVTWDRTHTVTLEPYGTQFIGCSTKFLSAGSGVTEHWEFKVLEAVRVSPQNGAESEGAKTAPGGGTLGAILGLAGAVLVAGRRRSA